MLFGLCDFSTFDRVVVIFVAVVTPHFSFVFLLNWTYTYPTGNGTLSTATGGDVPFTRRILSRFSSRMKYEIAAS